jgi:Zinc finger, C3HC4 type (RING finger)
MDTVFDCIIYTTAGTGLVLKAVYDGTLRVLVFLLNDVVWFTVVNVSILIFYTLKPICKLLFWIIDKAVVTPISYLMRMGKLLWTNVLRPVAVYIGSAVGVAVKNIKHRFCVAWREVKIKYRTAHNRCLADRGLAKRKEVPLSYEDELRVEFEKDFRKKHPVATAETVTTAYNCSICCQDSPDSALGSYFCGHVFCQECLSKVTSCPMCRAKGSVIKLFL